MWPLPGFFGRGSFSKESQCTANTLSWPPRRLRDGVCFQKSATVAHTCVISLQKYAHLWFPESHIHKLFMQRARISQGARNGKQGSVEEQEDAKAGQAEQGEGKKDSLGIAYQTFWILGCLLIVGYYPSELFFERLFEHRFWCFSLLGRRHCFALCLF